MNCAPHVSSVDNDFTKQRGVLGGLHSTPAISSGKQNGTFQGKDLGNSEGMNNAAASQLIDIKNAQSNHLPPMEGMINNIYNVSYIEFI